MNKKQLALSALPFAFAALVAACGGGGSGGDGSSGGGGSGSGETRGVLLDSPVANVGYRTETKEGVTDAEGRFDYEPGETVTFFIGDLEFPPIDTASIVTPLDFAGTDDPLNDSVVNMIRLLQTLDKDGDPSNGIEITDAAKAAATQLDFNVSKEAFESSTAVESLIFNAGQDNAVAGLVSVAEAVQHFTNTLLAARIIEADPQGHAIIIHANFYEPGSCLYLEVKADGKRYSSDGYEDDTVPGGACGMDYDYDREDRSTATFTCSHDGPVRGNFFVTVKRGADCNFHARSTYFDVVGNQHLLTPGGPELTWPCDPGTYGGIFFDGVFQPGETVKHGRVLSGCEHFDNPIYGHAEWP